MTSIQCLAFLGEKMRVSDKFQERFNDLVEEKFSFEKKTEVARQIGITYNTFSKIGNYGIVPKVSVLIRIADYFNVSIEYLLAESDDEYFEKSKAPSTFLERLNELKEKKEIKSYYRLAENLHLDRTVISNWLNDGFLPELSNLELLSDFFDVSIDYLLGRTDYER